MPKAATEPLTARRRRRNEYEAFDNARRTLSERDPDLAARIEFDPENAGTGILAPTRNDLVRVLEILGLDAVC